jgi:hypothetical protein
MRIGEASAEYRVDARQWSDINKHSNKPKYYIDLIILN